MNAADASAQGLARSSGFPASVLPDLHRSEAFVEDLFDGSGFAPEGRAAAAAGGPWQTALLYGVPLLVALLGGVLAFFHGMG